MGGFGSALGSFAEKAGKALIEHLSEGVPEHTGDLYKKLGRNMDSVLRTHPAGVTVADYVKDYTQIREMTFQKLEEPAKALWDGIGKDSQAKGLVNPAKDTIEEMHNKLGPAHPLAKHTGQLINQSVSKNGTSTNAGLTLKELSYQNHAQANLSARTQVFGPNSENLLPSVEELLTSKKASDNALGHFIMDSVSTITRDATQFRGARVSQIKMDVRSAFEKKNKLNAKYETGAARLPAEVIKTDAPYTKTSPIERVAKSAIVQRLAPFSAIPHLTMIGNLSSAPLKAMYDGMLQLGDKEFKEHLLASGLLNNTMHSMFEKQLEGASGIIGKTLGNDAGSLFYNATHLPLFDQMRFHQLSLTASVGYHSAIMWGKAAVEGDKRAIAELRQMRLDPEEIVKREGQLTESELRTAMFHFGNDRMFVARPQDSSLYASSNVFMRSATMFHKTINSQFNFMNQELLKLARAGDWKSIAQFAGTLGVLIPSVAPYIKSLSTLARTGSVDKAKEDLDTTYGNLKGNAGLSKQALSYIEMLSYVAGIGTYHSYVQAADHDRLATAAAGPLMGIPITLLQDILKGVQSGRAEGFKAVGRDVAPLAVPVVGKWLGYKLFPAKTAKGKSFKRIKRR
jgi:hypothetical protein